MNEAMDEHVRWLLGLVDELGYDLHALAHERDPLPVGEYDRRYNRDPSDESRR